MCTLLCKANTAKQRAEKGAGGQAGGWTGRPTVWRLRPLRPSSVAPNTREAAASDNTNSTMIGCDGARSAERRAISGVTIHCCFILFASADQRGGWGLGDWSVGRVCGC